MKSMRKMSVQLQNERLLVKCNRLEHLPFFGILPPCNLLALLCSIQINDLRTSHRRSLVDSSRFQPTNTDASVDKFTPNVGGFELNVLKTSSTDDDFLTQFHLRSRLHGLRLDDRQIWMIMSLYQLLDQYSKNVLKKYVI